MDKITHAGSENQIPIFKHKIHAHPRRKNSIIAKGNSIIFRISASSKEKIRHLDFPKGSSTWNLASNNKYLFRHHTF